MVERLGRGYISTEEVSEALGPKKWPVRRVRRWLIRHDAAVKKGGRWYTTRAKLRIAFGDVYEEITIGDF